MHQTGNMGCVGRFRAAILTVVVLLMALALGGCSTGAPPSKKVARVVITPGALLLTGANASADLTAQAFDADGAPIDAVIHWTSSDDAVAQVTEDGSLTTLTDLGSALITASADGVDSFPASIVVAQPVDGAVLLTDAQVLSPPTPVEGTADPIRQKALLSDPGTIHVGTVVIGSQAIGIGGRVEQATPTADGLQVVYAPLPPQELFDKLSIEEDVDLAAAALKPASWLAGDSNATSSAPGIGTVRMLDGVAPEALTKKCAFQSTAVSISGLHIGFENHLRFHLHLQDGVADPVPTEVYVDGKITQKTTGGLNVKAGFNDTVTCTVVLFEIPIPISGVASLVAHPEIPIGLAASLGGSVTGAGVSVDIETEADLAVKAGFSYDAVDGLTLFHDLTPKTRPPSLGVDLISPSHYRVGASAFIGLASGVDLKVAGLEDISLVQARLGPTQSLDLASGEAQADASGYASNYALAVTGTVSVGTDISKLLGWLGLGVSAQAWQEQVSVPISHSPTGTFTVSQADAVPGDRVHLRVALDEKDLTYLGHYNVSKVEIFRARGDEEPSLFKTIDPKASNQRVFETDWDTTGLEADDYRFYAFAVDDLLSNIVEVPLEVTKDSKQVVHLAGACTTARIAPRSTPHLEAACEGGTTWDYVQPPEANNVAWEVHTTGSDLTFQQDAENPKVFNLTGATVSWTDEAVYAPDSPTSCTVSSSGDGLRVLNTDPDAGAYVSGIIMLLDGGAYYGSAYVYIPDGATDGCNGGTVDENVPLFTTGTPSPTLQGDGHGGSLLVGTSTDTNDVDGVTNTSWSFDFPDLPPPG